MASDPELLAHQEWLGYLQPVGLVVSAAGAGRTPRRSRRTQHRPRPPAVPRRRRGGHPSTASRPGPGDRDFPRFCHDVLGWRAGRPDRDGRGRAAAGVPGSHAPRVQRDARARPTPSASSTPRRRRPDRGCMLIQRVADRAPTSTRPSRPATTTAGRPARRPGSSGCLRETQVPIGLLSNGDAPAARLRPARRDLAAT